MSDLKTTFNKEITKKLAERLGAKNPLAVPRLVKIVINASTADFLADKKNLERAAEDLALITGQKPKVAKAKISVSSFKLREGDSIGLVVTLRGKRMYDFFEKLVTIVFPRVRDFNGVDPCALDGKGNLSVGFTENTVFAEIDPGKVEKVRSLQVVIVTTARSNEEGKALLEEMGFPFKKVKGKK